MGYTNTALMGQLSPFVSTKLISSPSVRSLRLRKSKTEKFGEYVVGPVLGRGGLGTVRQVIRGRHRYAAKLIRKHTIDAHILQRLKNELRALSSLTHAHVARVHEVIIDDKYVGIIMDWAPNGDLFAYLSRNGPVNEQQAQKWLSQLVWAVDDLHSNCLVHRDIKLENILVDAKKNLILTDFEMCNDFRHQGFSLMSGSCGSPTYCPPEAVMYPNLLYDGCKADVWAIGVTLFACVCGYLPFDDALFRAQTREEIRALYEHIYVTPLTLPSSMSTSLRDLLSKMLDKSCRTRASIVDVRNHPWLLAHTQSWPKSKAQNEQSYQTWSSGMRLMVQNLVEPTRQVIKAPIIWDPFVGA